MTLCITKNDIPDYLKHSELYNNIESEDSFEIPEQFFKTEIIINTFDDFISYIKILNYWMVNKISIEFYYYVYKNKINMNDINRFFDNNYLINEILMITDNIKELKINSKEVHLTFKWDFNQPLEKCLPYGITHLTFGCKFTQPLGNNLPNSITHLIFNNR